MILLTLVCGYAACWGPTSTQGVQNVTDLVRQDQMGHLYDATIFAPLVVVTDEVEGLDYHESNGIAFFTGIGQRRMCYYFWFFGYVVKLPYERDIESQVQIEILEGLGARRLDSQERVNASPA